MCKGIAEAIKGNPYLFHSIMLDSNGMHDDDFADLFSGMN